MEAEMAEEIKIAKRPLTREVVRRRSTPSRFD